MSNISLSFQRVPRHGLHIAVLLTALLLSAAPLSAKIVDLKIDKLQFPKIRCRFRVVDASGHAVTSLTDQDFTLLEETLSGVSRVKGAQWSLPGQTPLTVAIVVDYSGSMLQPARPGDPTPKWQAAKKIALDLVKHFQPDDRALVETFTTIHNQSLLISPPSSPKSNTGNPPQLQDYIEHMEGPPSDDGETPICDALEQAVAVLAKEPGKRMIFLLTDGQQNAWDVPGAHNNFDNLIREAKAHQIQIIACGYGDPSHPKIDSWDGLDMALLHRLAEEGTDGHSTSLDQEQWVADFFKRRAQERREEYEVTFETSRLKQDGTDRRVTLSANADSKVRKYYQAPGVVPAELDRVSVIAASICLILIVVCLWPTWRSLGLPAARMMREGEDAS